MGEYRARMQRWKYALGTAAGLGVVWWCYWSFCWGAPTTVFLVRHADRDAEDALNASGLVRAQELAHVMEKSGLDAVYTSEFTRTQQTAAPAAAALGLTPVVISASDVAGLANHIRDNRNGEKTLVVGHSDTVPKVIAAFGGPAVNIPEDEFDNLYVLTLCRCRRPGLTVTNLQYGSLTP